MKKIVRIITTLAVLAIVGLNAVPAYASDLAQAQYMRNLVVTNNGAETQNNVVTFDPATLEMVTSGLINSSLTGSAITDLAGNDLIYMPKEPVRYKLVEYLEFTGTQYIDTGIVPSSTTKWIINLEPTLLNGSWQTMGALNSYGTTSYFRFYVYTTFGISYSTTAAGSSLGAISSGKKTVVIDSKNLYASCNSSSVALTAGSLFPDVTIYLMAQHQRDNNNQVTVNSHVYGKLYSSQIYDNGVLVRDFVPVERTTDNTLGLLDRVNNIFYPNNGTGTLTAGQYSTDYYICDYIESDGHQYIDTGFVPSNTTDVVLTGMFTSTPTAQNYMLANYDATSGTTNRYYLGTWFSSGNIVNVYGSSTASVPGVIFDVTTKYTCELNPLHGFGAINNTVSTFTPSGGSYTYSVAVSAQKNNTSNYVAWSNTRIYSLIMLNNGAAQRNMIPCYDATAQKAGLFDNVNNQMYYSGGSQNYLYNLSGNDGTWCLYLPTVAANTSLQERLYISTENLNSKISYFPGTSGLVVNRNTSNTITGTDDWNFTVKGQFINGDGSYLFKYGDDLYATLNGNTITMSYGTITVPLTGVIHNTAWVYYYGTTGSGWTISNSGTVSYQSNYISHTASNQSPSTRSMGVRTSVSNNPYNTMIIKSTQNNTWSSIVSGYSTSAQSYPATNAAYTSGTLGIRSLPTGSTIYPAIGMYNNKSSTDSIGQHIYMFALAKADSPWQYSGMAQYGSSNAAIIANSSSLVNDPYALYVMATKCTGDFMWACVNSSAFTTALASSPYKNILYASEDWCKALAWNTGTYSTTSVAPVALSYTQQVPIGYHTYDFRKEGNQISLYVDSNLVRGGVFSETLWSSVVAAQNKTYSDVVSYDTDAQIAFAQGGTTLYADQIQQKKNGNNVGQWSWAQTDTFTFPDLSSQGNTGYPSFRDTNYGTVDNGANLSISYGIYQPANVAQYDAPGSSEASTFTGLLPETEQPEQDVDLGRIQNVPFASVFEDLLDAGGIPSQLFWLPIMMTFAIAACGVAYHLTRDALISCIAGDVMLGLGCALSLLYTVPLVIGIVTTIVLLVKRKTISL